MISDGSKDRLGGERAVPVEGRPARVGPGRAGSRSVAPGDMMGAGGVERVERGRIASRAALDDREDRRAARGGSPGSRRPARR